MEGCVTGNAKTDAFNLSNVVFWFVPPMAMIRSGLFPVKSVMLSTFLRSQKANPSNRARCIASPLCVLFNPKIVARAFGCRWGVPDPCREGSQ